MIVPSGVGDAGGSRRLAASVATCVFVLSVLFRLTTSEDVFRDGRPRVPPFDDQYHALRIVHSALHFPEVLDFDPGRGVSGAYCPWPPLYDLAAGGLARLLGGRTEAEILARAVWFPVAVQAIFLAAFSFLVVRRFGGRAGTAAALALVFSIPLLSVSRLGSVDHHYVEPPLLLVVAAAVARVARSDTARDVLRSGLALSAALFVALFSQAAFVFAAGLGFLALFFLCSLERVPPLAGGLAFFLVAAAVRVYRATRPSGTPDHEWFLGTPHAAALLAAAAALLSLAIFLGRGAGRAVSRELAMIVGVATAVALPGALSAFGEAHFFGGDPWFSTVIEFQPLFLRSATPLHDLLLVGGGGLLVFVFAADAISSGSRDRRVLALFAMGYLAAGLANRRFLVAGAPLLALAGGAVCADRFRAGKKKAAFAAMAALAIPALLGAWLAFRRPSAFEPAETRVFERVARYLALRTDAPGRVLGPWSWGHLLHRLGGRPVLLDNFGAVLGRETFEAMSVVLMTREKNVADYCAATGVRFVVLENPLRLLPPHVATLGGDVSAYFRPGPTPGTPPAITRLAQTTFWWRAYFDRGAARPEAGTRGNAFRRFRLVYEDPQPSADPSPFRGPAAQVWELVAR